MPVPLMQHDVALNKQVHKEGVEWCSSVPLLLALLEKPLEQKKGVKDLAMIYDPALLQIPKQRKRLREKNFCSLRNPLEVIPHL